jgi:hypothetical protein
VIAEAGTITGFAANKFTLDTSGFTAQTGTPTFTISQVGNALVLSTTTPVPEPTTVLAIGAAAVGVGRVLRRRRGPAPRT